MPFATPVTEPLVLLFPVIVATEVFEELQVPLKAGVPDPVIVVVLPTVPVKVDPDPCVIVGIVLTDELGIVIV